MIRILTLTRSPNPNRPRRPVVTVNETVCRVVFHDLTFVRHFPALHFCPSNSSPAFSTPCNVLVRHFPVLHFQRPPRWKCSGAAHTQRRTPSRILRQPGIRAHRHIYAASTSIMHPVVDESRTVDCEVWVTDLSPVHMRYILRHGPLNPSTWCATIQCYDRCFYDTTEVTVKCVEKY